MTTPRQPSSKQNAMVREWTGLKKTGGRFVKAFAFELFLEEFYPELIKQMRQALRFLAPADIRQMILDNQFPELPTETYAQLQGYEEYLGNVTVQRMWAAMAEGCPELAMAVDEAGDRGYRWFWRFRERLLKGIRQGHPVSNALEKDAPMVGVTCDSCGGTVVVKKEEALKMTKCPLCGAPAADSPGDLQSQPPELDSAPLDELPSLPREKDTQEGNPLY
jgi:hypothetical protein